MSGDAEAKAPRRMSRQGDPGCSGGRASYPAVDPLHSRSCPGGQPRTPRRTCQRTAWNSTTCRVGCHPDHANFHKGPLPAFDNTTCSSSAVSTCATRLRVLHYLPGLPRVRLAGCHTGSMAFSGSRVIHPLLRNDTAPSSKSYAWLCEPTPGSDRVSGARDSSCSPTTLNSSSLCWLPGMRLASTSSLLRIAPTDVGCTDTLELSMSPPFPEVLPRSDFSVWAGEVSRHHASPRVRHTSSSLPRCRGQGFHLLS